MKQRFTLQVRGNVLYESEPALNQAIQSVLATFPEFNMTFKSVEIWQDGNGSPRLFNDDGTDYVAPSETQEEIDETQVPLIDLETVDHTEG